MTNLSPENYGLNPYHADFIKKIAPLVKGKTVLEIGGSTFPRKWLFDILGVKKWVCVDYCEFYDNLFLNAWIEESKVKPTDFLFSPLSETKYVFNKHDYVKLDGDATKIPCDLYDQFDVVVSLCAFEHISKLNEVVEKIYLCLKKGGMLYAYFGPIWSCSIGHHYGDFRENAYSFNTVARDGVLPFIHLLYDENTIRDLYTKKPLPFGQSQLDKLCKSCFHSNSTNRLFYEDYEKIMQRSSFERHKVFSHNYNLLATIRHFRKLHRMYPGYMRFDAYMGVIIAKKSGEAGTHDPCPSFEACKNFWAGR